MAKKILHIVQTAYRATVEEQDDPVLWLAASLAANGTELDVVLGGSAVSYLVRGQDAGGLAFGERRQTQPPDLVRDVEGLIARGISVYYLEEDGRALGIRREEILAGAQPISSRVLPELVEAYQHVWRW